MSFAQDVKTELCREAPPNVCCRRSELYGALLYAREFSFSRIVLQTENPAVSRTVRALLLELFGVEPRVRPVRRSDRPDASILTVDRPGETARILGDFGYSPGAVSFRLNRAVLENECCPASFLRGAFLSCGSMVEPEKDYHLEFVFPHWGTARDLVSLLREQGFSPKRTQRSGCPIVYFKESGQIEDLLTMIGAAKLTLRLMNVKVYKDLRNKVNRVTNCETANIERTVDASIGQIEQIRRLLDSGSLDSLPAQLRELALLRLRNPELSLRELGQRLGISRSGVDHRLRRILEIAKRRECHEGGVRT